MTSIQSDVQQRLDALSSIEAYIEWMRPEFLPDFERVPAEHHKLFIAVIESMANGLSDRDAVSVPPGSGKSFYFSIVGPTWLLAREPSDKVMCISASEMIAEDFSRRRRQIIKTERWRALASTELMPDSQSLTFQGTKEGGGIYTFGAGSTIQGIRADYLLPDDLVSGLEQAGNITQMDKLWNWYLAEARSRLRPGGREGMVATRWALLDPIGRVLQLTADGVEKWRYLRIPMICDSDDDPLGRKPGDRLWTDWYTEKMVADAQRNPIIWNTLYQQRPAAGEFNWVPAECIQIRPDIPQGLRYYIGVDISLGVAGGDYTVMAVVGVDEDKRFWLVDVYRQQADPKVTSDKFLELCKQYRPRYCWIEDDNASKVWAHLVQQKSRGHHAPLLISKMKNRSKEDRAAPLRTMFLEQRVFILNRHWTQQSLKELAEFPGGQVHDDFIDAFGVVAKELDRISPLKREVVDEVKPIIGNFQLKEGRIMTTQTFDQLITLNAGNRRRGRI